MRLGTDLLDLFGRGALNAHLQEGGEDSDPITKTFNALTSNVVGFFNEFLDLMQVHRSRGDLTTEDMLRFVDTVDGRMRELRPLVHEARRSLQENARVEQNADVQQRQRRQYPTGTLPIRLSATPESSGRCKGGTGPGFYNDKPTAWPSVDSTPSGLVRARDRNTNNPGANNGEVNVGDDANILGCEDRKIKHEDTDSEDESVSDGVTNNDNSDSDPKSDTDLPLPFCHVAQVVNGQLDFLPIYGSSGRTPNSTFNIILSVQDPSKSKLNALKVNERLRQSKLRDIGVEAIEIIATKLIGVRVKKVINVPNFVRLRNFWSDNIDYKSEIAFPRYLVNVVGQPALNPMRRQKELTKTFKAHNPRFNDPLIQQPTSAMETGGVCALAFSRPEHARQAIEEGVTWNGRWCRCQGVQMRFANKFGPPIRTDALLVGRAGTPTGHLLNPNPATTVVNKGKKRKAPSQRPKGSHRSGKRFRKGTWAYQGSGNRN